MKSILFKKGNNGYLSPRSWVLILPAGGAPIVYEENIYRYDVNSHE